VGWLALREKLVRGLEAVMYAAIAGVVSAILDYAVDVLSGNPTDAGHLWEVARAAGVAAGILYLKTPYRDPEVHADRHND
jgi:hypothetical protein